MQTKDAIKYRHLATNLTEDEVELLLEILKPGMQFKSLQRHIRGNYVEVFYCEYGSEQIEKMDLLPDDVYRYDDSTTLDGIPLTGGEQIFRYRQFMIAKGYSDYWLDNPYR